MDLHVIELPRDIRKSNIVQKFLSLREEIFVSKMGWHLNVFQGIEYEQYDRLNNTVYIILLENDQVVGGARLARCDWTSGQGTVQYSYMIRDAHEGLIDLPHNICFKAPPTDANTWELTRLISNSKKPHITRILMAEANNFIMSKQGTSCLFLGPPAFMKMAQRFGYEPEAIGPIVSNEDGKFLAFKCSVKT